MNRSHILNLEKGTINLKTINKEVLKWKKQMFRLLFIS